MGKYSLIDEYIARNGAGSAQKQQSGSAGKQTQTSGSTQKQTSGTAQTSGSKYPTIDSYIAKMSGQQIAATTTDAGQSTTDWAAQREKWKNAGSWNRPTETSKAAKEREEKLYGAMSDMDAYEQYIAGLKRLQQEDKRSMNPIADSDYSGWVTDPLTEQNYIDAMRAQGAKVSVTEDERRSTKSTMRERAKEIEAAEGVRNESYRFGSYLAAQEELHGEKAQGVGYEDYLSREEAYEAKLKELEELENSSSYITTTEAYDSYRQQREALISELETMDSESGHPERYYDEAARQGGIIGASFQQYAAGLAARAGSDIELGMYLHDKSSDDDRAIAESAYAGWVTDELTRENMLEAGTVKSNDFDTISRAGEVLMSFAEKYNARAAETLTRAKEGQSGFDKAMIDVETNMLQMGADFVLGTITGTGTLTPMYFRSAGGGALEAREAGASVPRQWLYGTASGATEVLTEKFADGLAGIYGSSLTSKAVDKLVERLARGPISESVIRAAAGAMGEGFEEVASSVIGTVTGLIYDENSLEAWNEENIAETISGLLYDFVIGAAVSALSGGVGSMAGLGDAAALSASEMLNIANEALSIDPENAQAQQLKEDIEGKKAVDQLTVTSAYMTKENTGASQTADANPPAYTAKPENVNTPVSGQSINDKAKKVNTVRKKVDIARTVRIIGENGARETAELGAISRDGSYVVIKGGKSFTVGANEIELTPQMQKAEALVRAVFSGATAADVFNAALGESMLGVEFYRAVNAADALYSVAKAKGGSWETESARVNKSLAGLLQGVSEEFKSKIWAIGSAQRVTDTESGRKSEENSEERREKSEETRYEERLSFEAVAGVGTEASDMASSDSAELQEIVNLAYALTELADGRLKINFFHGGKDSSIYGRYQNGRVDINADRVDANGANLIRITLSHELTHYIQDRSPRQYERLKSFMLDRLMDEQNLTLEELIQQKQAREPGLGYEGAIDEIVADGCEEMLLDPKIVEELAKKEKSLARDIVDWLRGVLDRLVNSITGTHKEATVMRAYAEQLREIWGQGLAEALASEETENNKNTAEDGGAKWSIKNTSKITLQEQIKQYTNRTMKSSDMFYFGINNGVIKEIGLPANPIVMTQSTYKKVTAKKHNIPRRVIKKLEHHLQHPICGFYKDGLYAFLVDDIDADGKPAVITLNSNSSADNKPVIEITSVFGLDNPKIWIENQIKQGKTLRAFDEQKTEAFFHSVGSARDRKVIASLNRNIPQAATESQGQFSRAVASPEVLASEETENNKNTAEDGGAKWSIESLPDGRKYVKADRQVIFGNNPESWATQTENYINGKIRKGEDVTLLSEDGDILILTSDTSGKAKERLAVTEKKNYPHYLTDEEYFTKLTAETHIDELSRTSKSKMNGKYIQDFNGKHGDKAALGWDYRKAFFLDFDNKYYELTLSAAVNEKGKRIYNIGEIKRRPFPKLLAEAKSDAKERSHDGSISQTATESQEKFSRAVASPEALANEETQNNKNAAEGGGAKWSIADTTDGGKVAVVDSDILAELDTSVWNKETINAAKRAAKDALLKFRGGIYVAGTNYIVNLDSRNEFTRSEYTEQLARREKTIFTDKMRFADVADDIIKVTAEFKTDKGLKHKRKDNFVDFKHGLTLIMSGKNKYQAEVVIGVKANGDNVFYDIVKIKPAKFEIESALDTAASVAKPIGNIQSKADSKRIVSQDNSESQEQFSRADVSPEELQKKLRESERARRKAEKLKAKAVEQAEYWRNQARVRPEKRMKAEDVRKFARDILKEYSYSSVKADELYGRLLTLAKRFTDYDKSTEAGWLYDEAYKIAQEIIDSSYARLNENGEIVPATGKNDKAQGIYDYFKGKHIFVSKAQQSDIMAQLGMEKFSEFTNYFRGRRISINADSSKGLNGLDAYWEELAAACGLDANITDVSEMFAELINQITLSEAVINPYTDSKNEAVYQGIDFTDELAREILQGFSEGGVVKTELNRFEQMQSELERKHAQEMQELRETLEKRKLKDIEKIRKLTEERIKDLAKDKKDALKEQQSRWEEKDLRIKARKRFDRLKARAEKMLKGTKNSETYAPPPLMKAIAEMCDIVNEAEQRSRDYQLTNLEVRLMDEGFETEQLKEHKAMIERAKKKLEEAHRQYERIKESPVFQYEYDENVAEMLSTLRAELENGRILGSDISSEKLNKVADVMEALMHSITEGNKARAIEKGKSIRETAKALGKDLYSSNVKKGLFKKLEAGEMWQMRPDTFWAYVCGFGKDSTGEKIQRAFTEGTERKLTVQKRFYDIMRAVTESSSESERESYDRMIYSPLKKSNMVDWGLKDDSDNEVKTSRGIMLQAYMLLCQEDSLESLAIGGFQIPNMEQYYHGNISGAYGIGSERSENAIAQYSAKAGEARQLIEERTELQKEIEENEAKKAENEPKIEEIEKQLEGIMDRLEAIKAEGVARMATLKANIEKQLTPYERKILSSARAWYDYSGTLLDEVNESLYGFVKLRPENYCPIHRNPNSVVSIDIRTSSGEAASLENAGFTKDRIKAKQPILLTDIFAELNNNQNKMSNFYGYAEVQHDFSRIWKAKGDSGGRTIAEIMAKRFGDEKHNFGASGAQYVENYIKSVAGGREETDVFSSIVGSMAGATLSLNPKVAVSQLASIPTAAAVVGWGNMAKGFGRGIATAFSTKAKAELADNSVWFWQRYRGEGGMRELADAKQNRGNIVGRTWNRVYGSKVGKLLFNWCQSMDVMATASMWAMAEETAKSRGIDIKTDAGKEQVKSIYRDIIRRSQPNYTVTERSDLLRNKSGQMKILTMYKTQSNQNLNILLEASGRLNRYKRDVRDGINGVTQADLKAAQRDMANAITAVMLGGSVTYAVLRTGASFLIGALSAYRDDDEEITQESVTKGTLKEIASSMFGMFAFGSEVFDVVYALVSGEKYYGMSDNALSAIGNALEQSYLLIKKAMDEGKEITWEDISKELTYLCNISGIPYANALKVIKAGKIWYDNLSGDGVWFETYVNRTAKQNANIWYRATVNGDEERAAACALLIENDAEGALAEAIRRNNGNIDLAAEALLEGEPDKFDELLDEIAALGFEEDIIMRAVKKALNEFIDGEGSMTRERLYSSGEELTPQAQARLWEVYDYNGTMEEYSASKDHAQAEAKAGLSEGIQYDKTNFDEGMLDKEVSSEDKDRLMLMYGSSLYEPYDALRGMGYAAGDAYTLLKKMDTDGNNKIKQEEAVKVLLKMDYSKAKRIWAAFGWKRDYDWAMENYGEG